MRNNTIFFTSIVLLLSAGACRKSFTGSSALPPGNILDSSALITFQYDTTSTPYPKNPVTGCFPSPLYGDTVLFPKPSNGSDYLVSPVTNPGDGHYLSWPTGLVIDSITGSINISKSQTGQRYAIGYVRKGTTDTCLSNIIIGGADYADSVYVLANGSVTALPYFNANIYGSSDCSGPGNSSHCSFDLTNSATNQKMRIDKHTGEIDLEKSLNGDKNNPGIFGSSPQNGATVTATIYYSLKKGSNNALQRIDIDMVYYDSRSVIDPGILNTIDSRLNNILMGNLISLNAKPRPPLVIIVRKM